MAHGAHPSKLLSGSGGMKLLQEVLYIIEYIKHIINNAASKPLVS